MDLPRIVAVLGLGVSGCAVAEALLRRGIQVVAADEQPLERLAQRERVQRLKEQGAELLLGEGAFEQLATLQLPLAVISPGISVHRESVQALVRAGTKLWGELEFSYRLLADEIGRDKVCLVAVTGTKGKTTTVHLIAAMLEASGLPTVLAGNVGKPLAQFVDSLPRQPSEAPLRIVMEVSSFQLATCETFRSDIAGITTLFVDHLDWHADAEDYRRAKAKIFANQRSSDWAVLNADNVGAQWFAQFVRGRILWCGKEVSASCPYCSHWVSDDGEVIWASLGDTPFPVMRFSDFQLQGEHNRQNLRVAIGAALLAGAQPDAIVEAVRRFRGVPHRLEFVAEINGVRFVNDSAATTPDAAAAGVSAFDRPVVLIAGGRDKGGDWRRFVASLKRQAKAVVLLGEFADQLERMVANAGVPIVLRAKDMEEAVRKAASLAEAGDVVLLSPGCASFDLFTNYAQRGEVFRQAVHKLMENGL